MPLSPERLEELRKKALQFAGTNVLNARDAVLGGFPASDVLELIADIEAKDRALREIGDIHRSLPLIDATESDRLTGRILRAREIADAALSTNQPTGAE